MTQATDLTSEAVAERRRQRGRRSSDLDGAYNDGNRPTPMRLSSGVGVYGAIAWIVITSAIGTLFILRSLWDFVAQQWFHG